MGRRAVRARTMYTGLAAAALAVAAGAAVLSVAGLLAAEPNAAGAAALCAAVFSVPGLAFFNYARQLRARDAALAHVAGLARDAGIVQVGEIAEALQVPREDAEKILRKAVREGRLRGTFDGRGGFVVEDAPRCASCGQPIPRGPAGSPCPHCGRPSGG